MTIARPPIFRIGYYDTDGNPYDYQVGRGGVTKIIETEECGEMSYIPWVEVWEGEHLLARFNQHKLHQIFYHDIHGEAIAAIKAQNERKPS